jgi:hypothetical protein
MTRTATEKDPIVDLTALPDILNTEPKPWYRRLDAIVTPESRFADAR